jgi:tetratricopeptide (TPR) repeat protein
MGSRVVGRIGLLIPLLGIIGFQTPVQAQPPAAERGERYALVVGVRRYDPNELRSLPYSEADAVGLAAVLRQNGYKPLNVVLMTQAAAVEDLRFLPTAERIRKELELLIQDTGPEDHVLVALAGHGVQFRGDSESYFCPAGAKLSDKSTLLSLGEIYKSLEKCKAGFKLLLVDTCRNDPQSDNSRARSVVDLESVTRPQVQEPPGGVAALFSCSAGEKAFEHADLQHGVFFHYVIEGLGGAATAAETGVTLPELELYVKKQVRDFVRAKYGVRQMPELVGRSRGLVPLVALDRAMVAYKQGKALSDSGEANKALALYSEAVRLNPELAAAYFERGKLQTKNRDYNGAVGDFNLAIQKGLTTASVFDERGMAYCKARQYDWAIADHAEAIRRQPTLALAYVHRADAWNQKGGPIGSQSAGFERATADCNEAIRLDPNLPAAYACRGDAFIRLRQYDRGIADCNEAIRLDPNLAVAYVYRGKAYSLGLGQYDRALADCNEAVRLDAKSADAYARRATAYVGLGLYDRGIADCNEAIRLDPKDPYAYANRGSAYDWLGQHDRAYDDYTAAIRLEPRFAQVYENRSRIRFVRGQDRSAEAAADHAYAISLDPNVK